MSALDLLNGLVLDDGRRWGAVATDWQRADALAVLEPGPDDPRLHWLGRPKGASKSTDAAGMSIAWLITQAPQLAEGFAVAADKGQANRLLDRARGLIVRSELSSVLRVESARILNINTGARVQALEADVAGAEGLLTPWVVVDELPNHAETPTARRMWLAVVSGIPKWPGMRLVVIGHAGSPEHWAHAVYEQACASSRWRVSEVPGPLTWVSADDLEEQRALLLPSDFERRHMNRWVSADDRLSTLDDVRACVTHEGPLPARAGVSYVITLDLGLKRDRTVATVAHAEWGATGLRVVVDRLEVWKGTPFAPVRIGDVEDWLVQAHGSYGGRLVLDPWQTVGLAQRMRERGLRVDEFPFTSQSVGRLAAALFRVLRDRMIGLPDDAELVDELAHVRLRETQPGTFRLDHDSGRHDDRAVSIALAVQALLTEDPSFEPYATQWVDHRRCDRGEFDATTDMLREAWVARGDPRFGGDAPARSMLDGRR